MVAGLHRLFEIFLKNFQPLQGHSNIISIISFYYKVLKKYQIMQQN